MREKLDIPEELLRACLRDEYRIPVIALDFLPLGLDTNAGVYRVTCEDEASYFLKAKRRTFYEPSCRVPGYLRDHGIASVVAPLATNANALWTRVREWTVCVYPFIEGDTGWKLGMTEGNWRAVGETFSRIHRVVPPPEGFRSLRGERFDPTEYDGSVRTLTQRARAKGGPALADALCCTWEMHQARIHAVAAAMLELARVLHERSGPRVICHADLHSNNILRDPADRVFVIDWDDVMLAPKERDFIFITEARTTKPVLCEPSPFFQGYGETAIDWTALTYYRGERIITDLIESAHQVFYRDDIGEETKADALRQFRMIVGGGEIDAVIATATHLL